MNCFSELQQDFSSRWKIFTDKAMPWEKRIFAGLELFCFPVSFLTIFGLLPLHILAVKQNWLLPECTSGAIRILLSAAVGYITNYIAIQMLFKPYTENWKHPLSLLTFGYWRQGLIPKNKDKIGQEIGHQVEEKLLNPEEIAVEFCGMIVDFIQRPAVVEQLKGGVQNLLHTHEQRIIEFLFPQIELSLTLAAERILTIERIMSLWENQIEPRLGCEENRAKIAAHIVTRLQSRTPELMVTVKSEFRGIAYDYLAKSLPFGIGAETLTNGLVSSINWGAVEERVREKLGDENTRLMFREELRQLLQQCRDYLHSPEGVLKLQVFIAKAKEQLRLCLHDYLTAELPHIADRMIDSPQLWQYLEHELLPAARPAIEQLLKTQGKEAIIDKLNLSCRVADSIAKQNVRAFHEMISTIAAEHLGVIQVLGYFLGALIGLIQITG